MKLAGTIFIRDGIKYDYCFKESIQCLLEFCDHVFVVDAGSTDGTIEELTVLKALYGDKLTIYCFLTDIWSTIHGKEKLVWFTDKAINLAYEAGYEWNFNLQADEILSEKSYEWVHKAIKEDSQSFLCSRINLWKNPFMELNVPHDRLPCSKIVLRLAKIKYRSYGDAESLCTDSTTDKYVHQIRIYHMGFVRKREVMKSKIINMQEVVFETSHDKKLDGHDIFQPDLWFSDTDLTPITEPLPKIIQKWSLERM